MSPDVPPTPTGPSPHAVPTPAPSKEVFGRVDVHAHLLPGIDDGCPTLEDSLACARMYVEHGYTHVCCTPHVWPTLQENTHTNIGRRTAALQETLNKERIPLTLLPGGEINLEWNWPAIGKADVGDIVSYRFMGKYLLFDFWADAFPEFLPPAATALQEMGFTLIMAHPERMKAVHADFGAVARFEKLGILLQCNTWCLRDPVGVPTRDISERLLKEGRYYLLGTDLHNRRSMPERMEGVAMAEKMVGVAAVRRLTVENPRAMLGLSNR